MSLKMPQFNDPQLQAALKRLNGSHRASAELRQKIEALLSQGEVVPARKKRLMPILAFAAVIAIVAGAGIFLAREYHERQEELEYFTDNEPLLKQMVAAHRTSAVIGQLQQDVTAGAAHEPLAAFVSKSVQRGVPDWKLPELGWQLKQLVTCGTEQGQGAITRLSKGGVSLTFITLPVGIFKHADENDVYAYVVDGNPVVGVARQGGIHCLVGDPSMPLDELRRIITN